MVLLFKYDRGKGGRLVQQQADLLFCVVSHGHVSGAPYPDYGKVHLTGRLGLLQRSMLK